MNWTNVLFKRPSVLYHSDKYLPIVSVHWKRLVVRRDFAKGESNFHFSLSHFCQHHAKALIHDFAMKTQQELKKKKVELFLRDALLFSQLGTRTTTFGTRSKSFAIWLQIPHFSSLRTFRQVLNLGLLTQSHKIGLEGIFFGQCAKRKALLPSTPNPTWIEEKRPKSGFSTSISLHSIHTERRQQKRRPKVQSTENRE